MQLSVTGRNAMLDGLFTDIGANAILKFFAGALPANCAAADSGAVLATLNLGATPMAAASGGSKSRNGTWQDLAADASGLARHYRIFKSDGATCGIQGPVSMPWAGGVAVQVGQQMHNGANVYVVTAAGTTNGTGGPSGTGTGITDGTVTWNYVGPVEMTIDNVDIATGQQVTVTGYTVTQGGA